MKKVREACDVARQYYFEVYCRDKRSIDGLLYPTVTQVWSVFDWEVTVSYCRPVCDCQYTVSYSNPLLLWTLQYPLLSALIVPFNKFNYCKVARSLHIRLVARGTPVRYRDERREEEEEEKSRSLSKKRYLTHRTTHLNYSTSCCRKAGTGGPPAGSVAWLQDPVPEAVHRDCQLDLTHAIDYSICTVTRDLRSCLSIKPIHWIIVQISSKTSYKTKYSLRYKTLVGGKGGGN